VLLVSTCQVQTAHGATRPRPPGHRVLDLCDHPWSFAPGLLLLPRSLSLHATPHLPPAHHETSKHDSLNETKVKEKQNETIPDSNSNLTKSMTHHNQTKKRTTWFLSSLAARSCYRYTVKQYFYKIGKITYLKIFTCIIEMMYCIHSS
jgi:hypothetical protein